MNMNSLLFIFLGLLSFCVNDEDLVKVKPINESFIEVIYKNYLESKNIDYQDLNTIDVYKISGRKERIASAYADKMFKVNGSVVDNQKLSPTNIVARLDSCSIEKLKINFIPNSNATTITKTIPVFIFYDSITKLEKKFNKHKSICQYQNKKIKYDMKDADELVKLCLADMEILDGSEWISLPSNHAFNFDNENTKIFISSKITDVHHIAIPPCDQEKSSSLTMIVACSGGIIFLIAMIIGISIFIYTKKKRSSENEVKETATVDVNELYGTDYTGEEEYYDDTEVKDYNDYYAE